MKHHPVFQKFKQVKTIGTDHHIFDFLGVATDTIYKKGWEKHSLRLGVEYTANYPVINEHYFDWIALLESVLNAKKTFRMAELGAGWAPWLTRAVFAVRQIPIIEQVELLAIEADTTHYGWIKDHFLDNGLKPNNYCLLNGAVSTTSSILRFPKLLNPDVDYGASLRGVTNEVDFIEVQGYTLENLLDKFSGPLDFLHVDIQGSEYDVIPQSMDALNSNVKAIMIGTHISSKKHFEIKKLFSQHGWEKIMLYPRNEEVDTEYGRVKFGDGFQFWRNSNI